MAARTTTARLNEHNSEKKTDEKNQRNRLWQKGQSAYLLIGQAN